MQLAKKLFTLTALAAAISATPALAYEQGDWIARVGAIAVDPSEDSGEIYSANGSYLGSGLGLYAGLDSDTQLGFSFTYMLSSSWGIELLAATPFEHDISLESKTTGGTIVEKAGETKHLPPTISLQWYPMDASSRFQPYLGAGINYTIFFEEEMSEDFNCATSAACAKTSLDLDDSIGLALQVGMDWQVSENVSLNAAVWWIDIDTEATITSPGADAPTWDTKTKFDVDVDPLVYMIGLAYKF